MNLIFFAPSNSIHSKKWIDFFKDKYQITWISFYKRQVEIDTNVNYIEITSLTLLLKHIRKINQVLEKTNVIHLHYLGKLSWLLLFFKNKKLIVSPWGSDIKFASKKSIKGKIISLIFKKSKIITVDAKYMIYHVNKFGDFKNKVRRINFGTDTKKFSYKRINKLEGKIKIISLRNLEKIYKINDVINAIDLMNKSFIDRIELHIFGSGNEESYLNNLVKKKKLNKTIFFKGRYKYENLPSILKNYNLYISTSSSDAGLAASTSEAMASGIPVISSDNSENKYWLSDCGFIYKTNEVIDLKEKLETIISNYETITDKRRKIARDKIVNENDFSNEMKKMNQIYLNS